MDDDPGVAAQTVMKEADAHIEGMNLPGPLFEENLGESPRRGSKIRRDAPFDGGLELRQRAPQLPCASAHILRLRFETNAGIEVHQLTGFVDAMVIHHHLPGKDEGLGLGARLAKAPIHEELVDPEPLAGAVGHWPSMRNLWVYR